MWDGGERLALGETAMKVAELLQHRRETVAVAESAAGGLVSAALLALPGASRFFLGGAVIYTARAREVMLGITPGQMDGFRSSSPPYAALLAHTIRDRFGATWSLAETGAAGPTANRYGDPPGYACLMVCGPAERSRVVNTGHADRAGNMDAFATAALTLLAEAIEAA